MLRVYGITVEDFARMFYDQKGCCAICGKKLDLDAQSTTVDHCHESGIAREILCCRCNTRLPKSLEELERYRTYLLKHGALK